MDQSQKLKTRPFYWRITAIITLIAFLATSIGNEAVWALTLGANRVSIALKSEMFKETDTLSSDTFADFPSDLGKITNYWGFCEKKPKANSLYEDKDKLFQESVDSSNHTKPIIFHIQDAHCNYAAQQKIREIIEYLSKKHKINVINLEGGEGAYDLSVFDSITSLDIRKKLCDFLISKGIINGAEAYAVQTPGVIDLWGVEDTELYRKNLDVYRTFLRFKAKAFLYIDELESKISLLKDFTYTSELREFDREYIQYKKDESNLRFYVEYLILKAERFTLNKSKFQNITKLKQSIDLEKVIDFKQAQIQRSLLIEYLRKTLSTVEIKDLVEKTVMFSRKEIHSNKFYSYLIKKANQINIRLKPFSDFIAFTEYISLYESIDQPQISLEIKKLESLIKEKLYTNQAQKELDRLSSGLILMRDLFSITMTREEFDFYKRERDSFKTEKYKDFIEKHSQYLGGDAKNNFSIGKLDEYCDKIMEFYEYSFKRDQTFLNNIKYGKPLTTNDQRLTTILITGGFHSDNLYKLFQEKNISYVSIMPNFKNEEEYVCPYFDLLEGKIPGFIKNSKIASSLIAIYSYLCGGKSESVHDLDREEIKAFLEYAEQLLGQGEDLQSVLKELKAPKTVKEKKVYGNKWWQKFSLFFSYMMLFTALLCSFCFFCSMRHKVFQKFEIIPKAECVQLSRIQKKILELEKKIQLKNDEIQKNPLECSSSDKFFFKHENELINEAIRLIRYSDDPREKELIVLLRKQNKLLKKYPEQADFFFLSEKAKSFFKQTGILIKGPSALVVERVVERLEPLSIGHTENLLQIRIVDKFGRTSPLVPEALGTAVIDDDCSILTFSPETIKTPSVIMHEVGHNALRALTDRQIKNLFRLYLKQFTPLTYYGEKIAILETHVLGFHETTAEFYKLWVADSRFVINQLVKIEESGDDNAIRFYMELIKEWFVEYKTHRQRINVCCFYNGKPVNLGVNCRDIKLLEYADIQEALLKKQEIALDFWRQNLSADYKKTLNETEQYLSTLVKARLIIGKDITGVIGSIWQRLCFQQNSRGPQLDLIPGEKKKLEMGLKALGVLDNKKAFIFTKDTFFLWKYLLNASDSCDFMGVLLWSMYEDMSGLMVSDEMLLKLTAKEPNTPQLSKFFYEWLMPNDRNTRKLIAERILKLYNIDIKVLPRDEVERILSEKTIFGETRKNNYFYSFMNNILRFYLYNKKNKDIFENKKTKSNLTVPKKTYVGGAWWGNPFYIRFFAGAVEPIIVYFFGGWIKTGLLSYFNNVFLAGGVATLAAGSIFWLGHIFRGKKVLFDQDVLKLAILTGITGIPLFVFGVSWKLKFSTLLNMILLAVYVSYHESINLKAARQIQAVKRVKSSKNNVEQLITSINQIEKEYVKFGSGLSSVERNDVSGYLRRVKEEYALIIQKIDSYIAKLKGKGALLEVFYEYKRDLGKINSKLEDIGVLYCDQLLADVFFETEGPDEKYNNIHVQAENIWEKWQENNIFPESNLYTIKSKIELMNAKNALNDYEKNLEEYKEILKKTIKELKTLKKGERGFKEKHRELYEKSKIIGSKKREIQKTRDSLKGVLVEEAGTLSNALFAVFERKIFENILFSEITDEKKRALEEVLLNSKELSRIKENSAQNMAVENLLEEMLRTKSLFLPEGFRRKNGTDKYWGTYKEIDFTGEVKRNPKIIQLVLNNIGKECAQLLEFEKNKNKTRKERTKTQRSKRKTKNYNKNISWMLVGILLTIICVPLCKLFLSRRTNKVLFNAQVENIVEDSRMQAGGMHPKEAPEDSEIKKKIIPLINLEEMISAMEAAGLMSEKEKKEKTNKEIQELQLKRKKLMESFVSLDQKETEVKTKIRQNFNSKELIARRTVMQEQAKDLEEIKPSPKNISYNYPSYSDRWQELEIEEIETESDIDDAELSKIGISLKRQKIKDGEGNIYQDLWIGDCKRIDRGLTSQYLVQQVFTKINPLTGEFIPREPLKWEPVKFEKNSEAAELYIMPGNGKKSIIVNLPPHVVITKIQTDPKSGCKSVKAYYEKNNGVHYFMFDKIPAYIYLGYCNAKRRERKEFKPIEIEDSVEAEWKQEALPCFFEILEGMKELSPVEQDEILRQVFGVFYSSTNLCLEKMRKMEPNFFKFAFKYFALDCEGRAMLDAVSSHEIGRPTLLCKGFADFDKDGRFYGQNYNGDHMFSVVNGGVQDKTEWTEKSYLSGKKAGPAEWEEEEAYIRQRAESARNGLKKIAEYVKLLISKKSLSGQLEETGKTLKTKQSKNQKDREQQNIKTYFELKNKLDKNLKTLNIPGMNKDNPEHAARIEDFLKRCNRFDIDVQVITNEYNLMAIGDFMLEALCQSRNAFPHRFRRIESLKKFIYDTIEEKAKKNNWSLQEPIEGHVPGVEYKGRWRSSSFEDLIITERIKTEPIHANAHVQIQNTTTIITDVLTGEVFEIPGKAKLLKVMDYMPGLLWVRKLNPDGTFQGDYLFGKKAGKYMGVRLGYGKLEKLQMLFDGSWLGIVNDALKTYQYRRIVGVPCTTHLIPF
ncbi:MAG: hypothetical protein ABH869_03960 [Candidatus Omnitrophota bacterium]